MHDCSTAVGLRFSIETGWMLRATLRGEQNPRFTGGELSYLTGIAVDTEFEPFRVNVVSDWLDAVGKHGRVDLQVFLHGGQKVEIRAIASSPLTLGKKEA